MNILSVCLFSQIWLYLIKYLLQLEYGGHAQRHSLLIAFSNEHPISLFVFSDLAVFDKVSTAIRITANMLNGQYLMIGSISQIL